MKELMVLILLLLVAAGATAGYHGVSNAVQFHYMCGVDIPWYAAAFLDPAQCPTHDEAGAPISVPHA